MALHYSNGIGYLFDKLSAKAVAEIKYRLIETDPTRYTHKKWWGEFSTSDKVQQSGGYLIELEDGRKGDCIISVNTEHKDRKQHYFSFYGRGSIDGRRKARG